MSCLSVAVVAPYPIVRRAIKTIVSSKCNGVLFFEAPAFHDLKKELLKSHCRCFDIVIMDAGAEGFSPDRSVVDAALLDTKFVLFSANMGDEVLKRAERLGACALIPLSDDCETISLKIDKILRGESSFISLKTIRNKEPANGITSFANIPETKYEVAKLVGQGMSNKEIARELNISECTVKVHITSLFKRIKVRNRTALAAKWLQHESRLS